MKNIASIMASIVFRFVGIGGTLVSSLISGAFNAIASFGMVLLLGGLGTNDAKIAQITNPAAATTKAVQAQKSPQGSSLVAGSLGRRPFEMIDLHPGAGPANAAAESNGPGVKLAPTPGSPLSQNEPSLGTTDNSFASPPARSVWGCTFNSNDIAPDADRIITIDPEKSTVSESIRSRLFTCSMTYVDGKQAPVTTESACNYPIISNMAVKMVLRQSVNIPIRLAQVASKIRYAQTGQSETRRAPTDSDNGRRMRAHAVGHPPVPLDQCP